MENIIEKVNGLVPVAWNGELVMTTAQLAEFYECKPQQIQQNYNSNVARFVKGKHFFRLEGDALKAFKRDFENFEVAAPQLNLLYLWTKRGAARHAKMLNTDHAWDVFELLEDAYFASVANEDKRPGAPFPFERGKEIAKLAKYARNPQLKEILIAKAAELLAGEKFVPSPLPVYKTPRFFK